MDQHLARRDALNAAERLNGAKAKAKALKDELSKALQQAAAHTDPHLTAEGLAHARAEKEQAARAKYAPQLQQLRAEIEGDQATVEKWVGGQRQQLDPAHGAQAGTIWEGVRSRLAAGISLQKILSGADADTARVIEKHAPAWLEEQSARKHGSGLQDGPGLDSSWLRPAVEARLAQVGDPGEREALALARQVRVATAAVPAMLGGMQAHVSGGPVDPLGSAIEAALAEQLASADPLQVDLAGSAAGVDGGQGGEADVA